ncbi:MAG: SpoIID/LytB domain-containing protein [Chitinophagales bacterium]
MGKKLLIGIFYITVFIAGVCWLSPGKALGVSAPTNIKVGLSTTDLTSDIKIEAGSYQVLADGNPITTAGPGSQWRAVFSSQKIQFASVSTDSNYSAGNYKSIVLTPTGDANPSLFSYKGKRYRGSVSITLNLTDTAMVIINELPLEQYLYGVLPKEMSNEWPLEALKAQAVAARTYAAKNQVKHGADGFSVCNANHCQVYGGYDCEGELCRQAVDASAGQVLIDDQGTLIYALYNSNSGGYTEDNRNVFGSDFSYLKGKPDPYSMGYGLSDWSLQISLAPDGTGKSLYDLLRVKNPDIAYISSVSLTKYPSGRVSTVTITDTNGKQLQMTGSDFGKLFNPGFSTTVNKQSFMSNMFDISSDASYSVVNGYGEIINLNGGLSGWTVRNQSLILPFNWGSNSFQVMTSSGLQTYQKSPGALQIVGHGWGHGVGMSQWGAYSAAKQGLSYTDILSFYYESTSLVTLLCSE